MWKCQNYGYMCMAEDQVAIEAGEGKHGWYLKRGQCMS